MKFPKFNFDNSYPLTLGVSDDYSALETRLKRLGRAPVNPRKRMRWAFGLALLVSFAAVVPVRLVARAQNEARLASELSGTVKDASGQSVSGATVYLMKIGDLGGVPLEVATTDAAGRYRFRDEVDGATRLAIFVDAGARGLGQSYPSKTRVSNPVIAPPAPVKLLFIDPSGQRAANLRVRVGSIGRYLDERWALPRAVAASLQTFTNARGEAVFPALPTGEVVWIWPADQTLSAARYGSGDLRGGQYAPLAAQDAVKVGQSDAWKTVRLTNPVRVQGRVTTPDGKGKSGVTVTAWRTDGNDLAAITPPVAQALTDADGAYIMQGLRSARYIVEVEPENWLTRDYISRTQTVELNSPDSQVDISLVRGVVIRGVVLQKDSGKPLVGQGVGMLDTDRRYQSQQTDRQGKFQFRTLQGASRPLLWVEKSGSELPREALRSHDGLLSFSAPKAYFYEEKAGKPYLENTMTDANFRVPNRNYNFNNPGSTLEFNVSEFVLLTSIKEGTTPNITIESALTPIAKPVTGTVVGPDGKAVENALISVEGISPASPNLWRGKARTDESGRFEVPAKLVKEVARLFARDGANADLVTARGTVVRGGDDVTLQLEPDVYGAAEGQITDEKTGRPLQGVAVICRAPAASSSVERVTTGADGRFRFERLRPFQPSFLQVGKRGYEEVGSGTFVLQPNETKRLTIALPPLDKTLSGRVLLANGRVAAAGYRVMVSTGQGATQTKADGSFVLPRVTDKKFTLSVISPDKRKVWAPYWTRGGRSDVTLQLTDARLNRDVFVKDRARESALMKSQVALIGRPAPPLQAQRWIGTPPSFVGKITLVQFVWMNGHSSVFNDFARAFGSRGVQVVGVEQLRIFKEQGVRPDREQYLVDRARDMGVVYPVALDKPLAPNKALMTVTGTSHFAYRGARFVIVGRDGKVKWVGGDPGQAIGQAAKLAN